VLLFRRNARLYGGAIRSISMETSIPINGCIKKSLVQAATSLKPYKYTVRQEFQEADFVCVEK
jgi:putative N-acetylmannosamine-6-phosphate epimerase